jgi:hypothetical protein
VKERGRDKSQMIVVVLVSFICLTYGANIICSFTQGVKHTKLSLATQTKMLKAKQKEVSSNIISSQTVGPPYHKDPNEIKVTNCENFLSTFAVCEKRKQNFCANTVC